MVFEWLRIRCAPLAIVILHQLILADAVPSSPSMPLTPWMDRPVSVQHATPPFSQPETPLNQWLPYMGNGTYEHQSISHDFVPLDGGFSSTAYGSYTGHSDNRMLIDQSLGIPTRMSSETMAAWPGPSPRLTAIGKAPSASTNVNHRLTFFSQTQHFSSTRRIRSRNSGITNSPSPRMLECMELSNLM
jgi:hypothetical protein